MTDQANSTTNASLARRWFTEGWTTAPTMADDLFSPQFRTNGLVVGVDGPRTTVLRRLAGFPDLTTEIEDLIAVDDTVVVRVVWKGTHSGTYGGLPPSGSRVEVRVMSIWRFEHGKVVDNWTIQDQFSLLQQVGYLSQELTTAQGHTSPVGPR
ncbi:ester cyclase [Dactylosporangium salmoneum]|uniref:Ester cyclase n=1 Tax=Dactylosporangium salmoneum TaxID=53361 RepID=A0ABP5TU87_9ACTN